jgi:hypothetical protein
VGHPEVRKANGCLFPPRSFSWCRLSAGGASNKRAMGSIESESLRGPMEVEMDTVNLIHRGLD